MFIQRPSRLRASEMALFVAPLLVGATIAVTASAKNKSAVLLRTSPRPTATADVTHCIRAIEFSPNGRRMATANEFGCVQVWLTSNGNWLQTLHQSGPSAQDWSCQLAFSPDGKILAGTTKSSLLLWSQPSGRLLRTIRVKDPKITAVAFSPDSQLVAVGTGTNALFEGKASVSLWRVGTGQLSTVFKENTTDVASVGFSPDGRTLAVSCAGNIKSSGKPHVAELVRMWNLQTKRKEWEVGGGDFGPLVFSRDGKILVQGSTPPMILKAKTGEEVASLDRQDWEDSPTWHIAFSPDGKILIDAGFRNPPRYWNTKTWQPIESADTDNWESISAAFSPNQHRLARGDSYGMVRLFDTKELSAPKVHLKHLLTINTVTKRVTMVP